jgi:hypothetical protein
MSESRQDADGHVYLAYYEAPWAFVWDGKADHIEVAQGGMGEPVVARIDLHISMLGHGLSLRAARSALRDTAQWWIEHGDRP